jgi:hypothetical protein
VGGVSGVSKANQFSKYLAERREKCAADCACLRPAGVGPFKMPRLK